MRLSDAEIRRLGNRLSRLAGQARGVQKMLEGGRDCEDVMMQLAAMKAAVSRIAADLIASNLEECVARGPEPEREERLERLKEALARF